MVWWAPMVGRFRFQGLRQSVQLTQADKAGSVSRVESCIPAGEAEMPTYPSDLFPLLGGPQWASPSAPKANWHYLVSLLHSSATPM